MKNEFEVRGDTTAIFLKSQKYGLLETLIDTSDLSKVQEYAGTICATYNDDVKGFYATCRLPDKDGKQRAIHLHRYLMGDPPSLDIDHENHNTLDNRRSSNLRSVSHAVNCQNRKGAHSDSKSGIRGVGWDDANKKWRAYICINGKTKFLGRFTDLEEASKVASEARKKYSMEVI